MDVLTDFDVVTWQALGDNQFRKWEAYDMLWERQGVELSSSFVCAAPNGGPIAVLRDTSRMAVVKGSTKGLNDMRVFSAAGVLLAKFPLEHREKLAFMGWTPAEVLVVVFATGQVVMHDVLGAPIDSFSLLDPDDDSVDGDESAARATVSKVALASNSLAASVVTPGRGASTVVVIDLSDPVAEPVVGLPPGARPTALAWVDGPYRLLGPSPQPPRLLIAMSDGSIHAADTLDLEANEQYLEDGLPAVVIVMAVAPNDRFVALMGEDGTLVFTSAKFDVKLLEFDTKAHESPLQLAWCGEDAVVVSWAGKGLLMVGPFGDWLKFPYAEDVHTVQEVDGLRVLTDTKLEMYQRVPPPTESIREIGGTSPGAKLFDAFEAFKSGEIKSEDLIRQLQNDGTLQDAVIDCLQAAAHEYRTPQQRVFLQAATFGKSFDPTFDSDLFVDVCRRLRVMNALRRFDVGIPLTYTEYDLVSVDGVLKRLMTRHMHKLALDICAHLNVSKDVVVVHWACEKIKNATVETDQELCDLILRRLAAVRQVSFADIASSAVAAGRRDLAVMLLDHEPSAVKQVELLLQMRSADLALAKAVASTDVNLMYTVVSGMLSRLYLAEDRDEEEDKMFALLEEHPPSFTLCMRYCKRQEPGVYRRMVARPSMVVPAARQRLVAGWRKSDAASRSEALREALDTLGATGATGTFQQRTMEDELQLLTVQEALDSVPRERVFTGRSTSATLEYLLSTAQDKKAVAMKNDLRIPETRFAFVKLKALVDARNFKALHKMAGEKKLAIGLKHFADACITVGKTSEALKFVGRMASEARLPYLMTLGQWPEAVELAVKHKDVGALQRIAATCSAPTIQARVTSALASLTA